MSSRRSGDYYPYTGRRVPPRAPSPPGSDASSPTRPPSPHFVRNGVIYRRVSSHRRRDSYGYEATPVSEETRPREPQRREYDEESLDAEAMRREAQERVRRRRESATREPTEQRRHHREREDTSRQPPRRRPSVRTGHGTREPSTFRGNMTEEDFMFLGNLSISDDQPSLRSRFLNNDPTLRFPSPRPSSPVRRSERPPAEERSRRSRRGVFEDNDLDPGMFDMNRTYQESTRRRPTASGSTQRGPAPSHPGYRDGPPPPPTEPSYPPPPRRSAPRSTSVPRPAPRSASVPRPAPPPQPRPQPTGYPPRAGPPPAGYRTGFVPPLHPMTGFTNVPPPSFVPPPPMPEFVPPQSMPGFAPPPPRFPNQGPPPGPAFAPGFDPRTSGRSQEWFEQYDTRRGMHNPPRPSRSSRREHGHRRTGQSSRQRAHTSATNIDPVPVYSEPESEPEPEKPQKLLGYKKK